MPSAGSDGAEVLTTGGLGFTGSTLAVRLVELGAHVTLVDAVIPAYGATLFTIDPVKGRVRVDISDIRDRHGMNYLVEGKDYNFSLEYLVQRCRNDPLAVSLAATDLRMLAAPPGWSAHSSVAGLDAARAAVSRSRRPMSPRLS